MAHVAVASSGKLAPLVAAHGAPAHLLAESRPDDCFSALCRIIVGQQLCGAAARSPRRSWGGSAPKRMRASMYPLESLRERERAVCVVCARSSSCLGQDDLESDARGSARGCRLYARAARDARRRRGRLAGRASAARRALARQGSRDRGRRARVRDGRAHRRAPRERRRRSAPRKPPRA